MRADIFTVCQDAKLSANTLNILGAVAKLIVPELPHKIQKLSIAARLRFRIGEDKPGKKSVAFKIYEPSGQIAFEIEKEANVIYKSQATESIIVMMVSIGGATIKHAGQHKMEIYLDAILEESSALVIDLAPPNN